MNTQIKKLPKNEVEISIEIPWDQVEKKKDQVLESLARQTEIKGFRKGKAPKKVILERINQTKLTEELLQELIPTAYSEAVKEHHLKPVCPPQVTPVEVKTNKPWKFRIRIAEPPQILIGDYQKVVKEAKKASPAIWTPGKEMSSEEKKPSENEKLTKILEALLAKIEVELSDLLIEQETNRVLSQTLEEIKSLGMTLEAYLASLGKTADQLREEYRQQATRSLKLEFILQVISDQAQIKVEAEEISKVIASQKDEGVKAKLRNDSYAIASMLRRQKTLTHLLKL